MQRRIDHLEGLVKRLISQRQDGLPNNVINTQDTRQPGSEGVMSPVASNPSDVVSIAGTSTTVIDGVQSVYKVADDWHDVLQEVRRFLSP